MLTLDTLTGRAHGLRMAVRAVLRALAARHPLVHAAAIAAFAAAASGAAVAQQAERPITSAIVVLLGVTVVGALEGIWGGIVAALTASLIYNFFLIEPTFRFSLASLEDYVPIVAFNASAIAGGLLTGRLKDRALAAESATRRVEALLELSRQLQAAVDFTDISRAIGTFAGWRARLDPELYLASGGELEPVQVQARHADFARAAFNGPGMPLREENRGAFLLSSSDAPAGILVLEWEPGIGRYIPDEDLGALVNLVSITVERCLLLRKLSEAELVRKSEEFKTALLSSISHDMRTPLSAITASASSLARYGPELPEQAKADMLTMIQEQCQRLNRYTTNLLNLGRLQAGLDRDRFTQCDAIEVLGSAIANVRGLGTGHEIVKKLEAIEALVRADPVMLEQVFYNILENSVRYSKSGSRVTVSAVVRRARLLVSVRDVGRGISVEDFGRIFDRFYRTNEAHSPEGSGLGLAIAKGFTEAFGGRIWAGLPDDAEGGTIVTVELPLDREKGGGR